MNNEINWKLAELLAIEDCGQQHKVQLEISPQGLVVGPIVFNIFINYLDDGTDFTFQQVCRLYKSGMSGCYTV